MHYYHNFQHLAELYVHINEKGFVKEFNHMRFNCNRKHKSNDRTRNNHANVN